MSAVSPSIFCRSSTTSTTATTPDCKPIGSIDGIADDALLDALLDEYAGYVAAANGADILR